VPLSKLVGCAASGALCLVLLSGCAPRGSGTPPGAASGQAAAANESADEFVTRVNAELAARAQEAQAAGMRARQALEESAQLRREAGESLMVVGSSGRRRAT